MPARLELSFQWPHPGQSCRQEFIVGAWHPSAELHVTWSCPAPPTHVAVIEGRNWVILSTSSPFTSRESGLAHVSKWTRSGNGREAAEAIGFRGYILEPPIHSWSDSKYIIDYWSEPHHRHNGVFAAVSIQDSGRILELVTDAFGIGPLYYRMHHGLVLFATNARYLSAAGDEPDYLAWRSLIQSGFLISDRTLARQVRRAPSGHVVRFHGDHICHAQWCGYEEFPAGTRHVEDSAAGVLETSFQTALSRCLRLNASAATVLPLSSGHDSRRILAGLLHRRVPFEAITARTLLKGNRDLDATFASAMAREFGFPHRVVDVGFPLDSVEYARLYAQHDRARRLLVAAETKYHTWAVPLMGALPDRPTLFLDGVAGDALGNSGFVIPGLHEWPEADREIIAHSAIGPEFDAILDGDLWPSATAVRQEVVERVAALPAGLNQAELAFLLLHTRRAIAPWAQQMLPPGHVVACPYLDLDHVHTALSYHPAEKYQVFLQRRCLDLYWPRLACFPGTRNIPSDMAPGSSRLTALRTVHCFRQLQRELLDLDAASTFRSLLTTRAWLKFHLATRNDHIAVRTAWAFAQLMEILVHSRENGACWTLAAVSSDRHLANLNG